MAGTLPGGVAFDSELARSLRLDAPQLVRRLGIDLDRVREWVQREASDCQPGRDRVSPCDLRLNGLAELAEKARDGRATLLFLHATEVERLTPSYADAETVHKPLMVAALQGMPAAQAAVGHNLLHGLYVPRNPAVAFHWNLNAARGGNNDAAYSVAFQLLWGLGVPQQRELGLDWLRWCALRRSDRCLGWLNDLTGVVRQPTTTSPPHEPRRPDAGPDQGRPR